MSSAGSTTATTSEGGSGGSRRDAGADGGTSAAGGKVSSGGTSAGSSAVGGSGGSTTISTGTGTAVASKGCGNAPTVTSGSRTLNGRKYIIRIPSNYDKNTPYRLVFAFHWNGGTMEDIDGGGTSGATWSYYGLQAQANNTTIFVAPQGNGNGWANSGGADLKFVDDMLALFQGDLCIDNTRIFSVGFSYGGGMSYAIACARAKVFRAVAVYSGAQLSGCDGGKDPIAYLGIHGIGDPTCGIAGGRSLRNTFVTNDGCASQEASEVTAGNKTHKCYSYTGCKAGYPVEWCTFDGGHTPGNVDGGGDDGAKTWTKGEVWKFFTQF
jgi:poly(3-hydroxybutyrate) depolymerase